MTSATITSRAGCAGAVMSFVSGFVGGGNIAIPRPTGGAHLRGDPRDASVARLQAWSRDISRVLQVVES